MKIKAEWQGREKLMARLENINYLAPQAVADAMLKTAEDMADKVRSYAPSRTGHYRSTINAKRLSEGGDKGKSIKTAGNTKDPYGVGLYGQFIWRFLEFGTVHQHAQPHIFPVYRIMKKQFRKAARDALRASLAGRNYVA